MNNGAPCLRLLSLTDVVVLPSEAVVENRIGLYMNGCLKLEDIAVMVALRVPKTAREMDGLFIYSLLHSVSR